MVAVSILDKWFGTHPDEQGLWDTLAVSGLSSAFKAKKRAELLQQLQAIWTLWDSRGNCKTNSMRGRKLLLSGSAAKAQVARIE
jgi:hypothetical protein